MSGFRLGFSFEIAAEGEPVSVEGTINFDAELTHQALKTAFVHAVHESYGPLWGAIEARRDKAKGAAA